MQRFRFCGDADCPDWVLAEINTLSRLSSIKLKLLARVVAEGLLNPPLDVEKAKKLFAESKLDLDVDLKACIACLSYIIFSTIRFNCNHGALLSELQQLGLPREHSTSIKKVIDDHGEHLVTKLKATSLKVNALDEIFVYEDPHDKHVMLDLDINGEHESVILSPLTVDVLLGNLKKSQIYND
ncbi:hypothetical protein ILUMI_09144 [Ignelater luminosus]|uniref:COMM domain-containing protein 4 n=1 Tax=Ignelater luminosus TaxID=2038154 RepID=A0A8K0GGA6_IGNLU|nr:hypothetical protein ILUMI_09144 [Ignelater luminosus]